MSETKHTPVAVKAAEWQWHDDYCPSCGSGHESLESDKEGILLHNAAWSIKSEHKKLIASAPTLQSHINRLEAERAELRTAMIETLEILGNDYCEDSRMDHAVKIIEAVLAKAEPEKGDCSHE